MWWLARRSAAAPPPTEAPKDSGCSGAQSTMNDGGAAVAAAYGVKVSQSTRDWVDPKVCSIYDWILGAFKSIIGLPKELLPGCDNDRPSAKDAFGWDYRNRQLNGVCRGQTDSWHWVECPRSYRPTLVAAGKPGICVSFSNGCSPVTFATAAARAKCKPGTHLWGLTRDKPEFTSTAETRWRDCLADRRRGGSPEACRALGYQKPPPTDDPIDLSRWGSPWSSWLGYVTPSQAIGAIGDAMDDAIDALTGRPR